MAGILKITGGRLLCFSQKELANIFGISVKSEIRREIEKTNPKNQREIDEIGIRLAKIFSNDRDIHEIFVALFGLINFYPDSTEICFQVKQNFDPVQHQIMTLSDINNARLTDSDTDFVYKNGDELRYFQLKRYKGPLEDEKIFSFIKERMEHYGNDLSPNLLLIIQSPEDKSKKFDSRTLHDKLKVLKIRSKSEILISHFTYDGQNVITRIYPDLAGAKRSIKFPTTKLKEWGLE